MKRLFGLILFLLICSKGFTQIDMAAAKQLVTAKIDSFPEHFKLSVALIKGDEVQYLGFGMENSQLIDLDLKDSLFEIGSVTKVFTATLLAQEIINERISEKDLINDLFSFQFKQKIKLNYLSLANHTSGLSRLPSNMMPLVVKNPQEPYKNYTPEMLEAYLKNDLILEGKKKRYAYSNLGAGLLAHAISKLENKGFEELLNEVIFSKYHMNATAFNQPTSFEGLDCYGKPAKNWDFNALKGAGGLVSSTAELVKFLNAQFDSENETLALTRAATHKISKHMSIGLGWHILNPGTADEFYWHNGGTGGFTSSVSFRTTNKTGVVVLSNISAICGQSPAIDQIAFELLNLLKQ